MKALFDLRCSISSDSDSNNTDTDLETEEIWNKGVASAEPFLYSNGQLFVSKSRGWHYYEIVV